MCSPSWIKVSTNTFSDIKIRVIQSSENGLAKIGVWHYLIEFAGMCNEGGALISEEGKPYDIQTLSVIFNNMPVNFLKECIDTFVKENMMSIDDGCYSLSNWAKHQNVEKLTEMKQDDLAERRKAQQREASRKYRQKKQQTVNNRQQSSTIVNKSSSKNDDEMMTGDMTRHMTDDDEMMTVIKSDDDSVMTNTSPNDDLPIYKNKNIDKDIYIDDASSKSNDDVSKIRNKILLPFGLTSLPPNIEYELEGWLTYYGVEIIDKAIAYVTKRKQSGQLGRIPAPSYWEKVLSDFMEREKQTKQNQQKQQEQLNDALDGLVDM